MRYLTLIVLTLALYSGAAAQQRAADFTATAVGGKTVELEALKGKVVVMAFWTTRCPICHSEIPKLNKLAGSYSPQDVVFLAPTTESEEKIAWYTAKNPFNFEILPNQFGLMLKYANRDKDGNLDMGYPSYFVISPAGTIEYRANGWDRIKTLESTVNKLIVRKTAAAGAAR
jgi:peroxiredoxin